MQSTQCPVNPRWLAPEILKGARASTASDVFSYGEQLCLASHPIAQHAHLSPLDSTLTHSTCRRHCCRSACLLSCHCNQLFAAIVLCLHRCCGVLVCVQAVCYTSCWPGR